jgi:phytoene dehydrogenase-like protein
VAWLPDRTVVLHRDPERWHAERLRGLGDTPAHRAFWELLDELARVFWAASRRGVKLPLQNVGDVIRAVQAMGLRNTPQAWHLVHTLGWALRRHGLREERPLVGLLSMLVEDTAHATVDRAPLINAALGITIRGAGLTRACGGMRGFWQAFGGHYRRLGGELRLGCAVQRIDGQRGYFRLSTAHGTVRAPNVVCAVPSELAARIGPPSVAEALAPSLRRDAEAQGGAIVVCLGVPEHEVAGQAFTHHQLLQAYDAPLGNGNNMFVSVSAPGDTESAPEGYRSVMISTHCELGPWEWLSPQCYEAKRQRTGELLIGLARRVYPELGRQPVVCQVGTPRTYERFTGRPRGAVGGLRLSLRNANQLAVPHHIGVPGYWLVGDTTWPGLGTVACVLGSRLVAEQVLGSAHVPMRREASFPDALEAEAPHALRVS